MEVIKHCLVCGKEFKACNTCQKNIPEMLQWRRVVCCPEHFSFHMPIIEYHNGVIDKETAKSELQNAIDAYGNIDFCDNVKGIVEEILTEDEVTSKCDAQTYNTEFVPKFANKSKKKNK